MISGILADPEDFPDDAGDDNTADTLEGRGGADRIILGSGDQAYGEFAKTEADGLGATFVVGTGIAGPPATVHDFDPDADEIEYYNAGGETLEIIEDSDVDGVVWVLTADGDEVLRMPVGTSGDVITLLDHVTELMPST